jgi:hypothetical protein
MLDLFLICAYNINMTKYFLFFVTILLSSCTIEPTMNWLDFDMPSINWNEYKGDNKIEKINNWCQTTKNIDIYDDQIGWFVQYPKETLELKKGNCNAKCLAKLGMIYQECNIKGNLIFLNLKDKIIGHSIIEIENKIYDGYEECYHNLETYLIKNPNYYFFQRIPFDNIQTVIDNRREKSL